MPDKAYRAAAVVLAAGSYPCGEISAALLAGAGRVVCCDGAADEFIARGGSPAAIVGDGDSLSPANRTRYADLLHVSADQESNDQTKAVRFCFERGWSPVVILGATGRREDHTVGNISLLADYVRQGEAMTVTDYGVFNAIDCDSRFESRPGQQVSIFTLSPATRVGVSNLQYIPPAGGMRSWWQGTLNESLSDEFTIRTDGPTLVFRLF
ncbi:MAG: thiamine diphosphokinase [Rikenellaceae bacterium]|nr:thiamine diphosphokinase [Rikenellaceae bacterium]